jgi:hypothetical protein
MGEFIVELTKQNHHEESGSRKAMEGNDHWESRQSARTAHECSKPLGWAEIQHPFHPLRGQNFPVLKKRRVSGVDTLILRGLEHGTFCVHREWTNWADPCPYVGLTPPRLNIYSLFELVELLEQVNLAYQECQHVSTIKALTDENL